MSQEAQVSYRHPDGQARFVQYAHDPLPVWAVDVQPHQPESNLQIDIAFTVKPTIYVNVPPAKMEEFRMALRRQMLQFVFEAADSVGIPHQELEVDGTIKLSEG